MAKLKEYRNATRIPGLPDTTNITDPQLRLFLDRMKLFCSELAITVNSVERYNNIENIVADLVNSENFNSIINKTITQTVSPMIDEKVKPIVEKINKKDIKLTGLDVYPGKLTINMFMNDTVSVSEKYSPSNTSREYKGVRWSSSDTNIATVSQDGTVTAVAVGECLITATSTYNSAISASANAKIINAESIVVEAAYQWCDSGGDGTVFTELSKVSSGDLIWASTVNDVTLYPDKGEFESMALAAKSSISTTDDRAYFSADNKVYWRDAESDVVENVTESQVRLAMPLSRSVDYDSPRLWVTAGDDSAETGTIYSDAFMGDGEPTAEDIQKYNAAKLKVSDSLPFYSPAASEAYWCLRSAYDRDGNALTPHEYYGYMRPTGESTTLTLPDNCIWNDFGYPYDFDGRFNEYETFDGKITAWCTDQYTQPTGAVAAFPDKPDFYWDTDWGLWRIGPDTHTVQGWQMRSLGLVSGKVFQYDGILWSISITYAPNNRVNGKVWDAAIAFPAWSLSPCHGDETVYTQTESPKIGDEYGNIFDNTFSVIGNISNTGDGTYSITDKDGKTYYRH